MRSLTTKIMMMVLLVALALGCSGGASTAKPEPKPECLPQDELCNGQDEDCDGVADNGFDELGQPCSIGQGECANNGKFVCSTDGQAIVCDAEPGQAAQELCDQKDNDCDGVMDNGFDLASDPKNCGSCGIVCAYSNAQGLCLNSQCALGPCSASFWNLDEQEDNGCEYACNISQGGQEICDGQDNDCDGSLDEEPEAGQSCDDGLACTVDSCSLTTSACLNEPDDLWCDDGDVCTGEELCLADFGCQSGVPLTCDDSLWCNGQETCDPVAGCLTGTLPVLSDNLDCTIDLCDEDNDLVVHLLDDSFCDDANVCNGLEICGLAQGCLNGAPLACNDEQFCNGQESCDPIIGCQAGTPPVLSDNIQCTVDSCDEAEDKIIHLVQNALCDDGLWCNGQGWCDAVKDCQSGTAPLISDGVECTTDFCDEEKDVVVHAPNQTACDDGLWCNGAEICDPAIGCQAGLPLNLSDGIACTVDTCDENQAKIIHAPDNTACSDNNLCNGVETCDSAKGCLAGTPLKCDDGLWCNGVGTCDAVKGCQEGVPPKLDDGIACTDDTCDEEKDQIAHLPKDGKCSDDLWCNGLETCDPQKGCQGGALPSCNDQIACTQDVCNEATDQCDHLPQNNVCDDSLWCNGTETCDTVKGCLAGTPPNLSDGIACTTDSCNEANDQVAHTPVNSACSDSNVCNGVETCDSAKGCLAGTPLKCDDGLWCNGQETCDAVKDCQAGTPPVLSDNIQCTVDSCDEAEDKIIHLVQNALCDDGLWCNGSETCDSKKGCQTGIIPAPSDDIACTTDICDETQDKIIHTPDNTVCSDKNICNGIEKCSPILGCQLGASLVCDDGLWCNGQETCDSLKGCQSGAPPNCLVLNDQCNKGACNEILDKCEKQPVNAGGACNDGTNCTSSTVCQSGNCVGDADKDIDGDGYIDSLCGGDDCNDTSYATHPGAEDVTDSYCFQEGFKTVKLPNTAYMSTAGSRTMAVDLKDKIHLLYSNSTFADFYYATNATDTGQWLQQKIGSCWSSRSIAIDSKDKVHISYKKAGSDDLMYLTNAYGAWFETPLATSGDVGAGNSIGVDSADKIHISYRDDKNGDLLKYATNVTGEWIISIVDNNTTVGNHTSIAVDSNDKVHISYFDKTKTDLKYATNMSGTWVASTVDLTGNVGSNQSIALDSANKVHISYFDDTNDDLKYATNTSGNWVVKTVDFYQYVGIASSIAVDANDAIRIAYWYGTDDELKYATNKSGSFKLYTLDSDGFVGNNPSIALDSNNKVHIIHAGNGVRHTYETCGWWGDSEDSNCDGVDGIDDDGDGYASLASGGDDCNDNDFKIYPGNGCP